MHGKIRRYTSPDEHAFYPEALPPLALPPLAYDAVLAPGASAAVNINARILGMYLEHLLPEIAAPGDDNNYGSSAMHDVTVLQVRVRVCVRVLQTGRQAGILPLPSIPLRSLPTYIHCMQALSKRIHYGKFVAEAKFRKQTAEYRALIARQDSGAILELLTDRAVELKVCVCGGGGGRVVWAITENSYSVCAYRLTHARALAHTDAGPPARAAQGGHLWAGGGAGGRRPLCSCRLLRQWRRRR